jgi:hypothetical protein
MSESKEPPHVICRPWDGSHPPPVPARESAEEVDHRGLLAIRNRYAGDLDLADELGECDPFLEALNEAFNAGALSERDRGAARTPPIETVLTCVYCGQEYPAGTPASGGDVAALTGHIATCEKHPMRELTADVERLRRSTRGIKAPCRQCGDTLAKCLESTCCVGCSHEG